MRLLLITACSAYFAIPGSASQTAQAPGQARYSALRTVELNRGPVTGLAYRLHPETLAYSLVEGDSVGTWALDLPSGAISPLFDSGRLREAIGRATGVPVQAAGTPFRRFAFTEGSSAVTFRLAGARWSLDLDTYRMRALPPSQGPGAGLIRSGEFGRPDLREVLSPDRSRVVTLAGREVAIRDVNGGADRIITSGTTPDREWGYLGVGGRDWAWWSPGGTSVAIRRADLEGVEPFPLVRWLEDPPRVEWLRSVHNVRVGARLPKEDISVWHSRSDRLVPMDLGPATDAFFSVLGWRPGGAELMVLRVTRDYRQVRLLALDPETGSQRVVFSETHDTCWPEPLWAPPLRRYWPLADGQRFLWKRDLAGWDHLTLWDYEGAGVVQLTSGTFQVDDVIGIDEERGWVYFTARSDTDRPYDVHVHRVRLDGSGLMRLTQGPGRHAAELVVGNRYLEVWRRSVNGPTELQVRRSDGRLVRSIAASDLSPLRAAGWTPPEEFTVKAADGETELWGVMYKPADFDPSRRYPVVEFIYGGPVAEYVPRQVPYSMFPHALAQLGYIVVKLDARGTPGRGKRFLEAGWDRPSVVIADHAGALRQLGERHDYVDLERVAVVGQSWGGNFTTRALLLAPELYRVGVAVSGGWWGDPELGGAKASVFEQCADLRRAEPEAPPLESLQGNLLVVHGTADLNLSGSTDLMWWLDAVAKAGKFIDLMILPDRPHELLRGDPYVQDAVRRYLALHLSPPRPEGS